MAFKYCSADGVFSRGDYISVGHKLIPNLHLNFGSLSSRYNETGQDPISEGAIENQNLNTRHSHS